MSKLLDQKITKTVYIILIILLATYFISPFIIPLVFSATISMALFPLQKRLEAKGISRRMAAGFLTFLFTFVISIPVFFFAIRGVMETTQWLEKKSFDLDSNSDGIIDLLQNSRLKLLHYLEKYLGRFNATSFFTHEQLDAYFDRGNLLLLSFFRNFLTSLPILFVLLLITVICTYSFLKNGEKIKLFFKSLFGFSDDKMNTLVDIFIKDSRQIYITNIVTGGVQSFLVALSSSLLGLSDFFLIFFITLILSFIPVVGASPVAFFMALYSLLLGHKIHAIIMLFVGVFTGVIDNFIRPWLTTFGQTRAPPIVIFVFILGGALLLGFPGLFLGIFIGSIAYDTLPIFWEEYRQS
ncbi:MAG: AI-2E family transporter [Bacteriovoracaceae bacterium]